VRIHVFQEPAIGSIMAAESVWLARRVCGVASPNVAAMPAPPSPRKAVRRETELAVMV
jgi:hypothetical protein